MKTWQLDRLGGRLRLNEVPVLRVRRRDFVKSRTCAPTTLGTPIEPKTFSPH
jgi:hypothetical protein